ncbi:hypothetical protein KR044_001370 [Drosophila immigrans]|nr:hypothetical protein KR044_001370 [Drosophila immigrans]
MSNLSDNMINEDNQNVHECATNSADREVNLDDFVSLKDMVQKQLSNILTKADIKREINEMLMLLPPQRIEMDSDYVKLDDLKSIVRKVVIESLQMQKIYNKQFCERLEKLEKVLWHLNRRVSDVTDNLKGMKMVLNLRDETSFRLNGGKDLESELISIPNFAKASDSGVELSAEEKQMLSEMLNNVKSEDTPSSSNRTKGIPPMAEETQQRAAAMRQYEANMLMYRKSQFSLQLNNRTQWNPTQESPTKGHDRPVD